MLFADAHVAAHFPKERITIMQKDALNNVHISAEQILITPEELKNRFPLHVKLSPISCMAVIRDCSWCVVLVPFTIWMRRWNTRVI
jgi:hypothetical protein